jgi:hypothetical protein
MAAEPLHRVSDLLEPLITIGTLSNTQPTVEISPVTIPPITAALLIAELFGFLLRLLHNALPAVLTMASIRFLRYQLPRLDVVSPAI